MFDTEEDYKHNQIPEETSKQIADFIVEVVAKMGVEARVSIEENLKGTAFNISSRDSNLLIGQHGANLYALQLLAQSAAYKKWNIVQRFTVDVDDYKKKREWYLRETAKRAVEQVKRTHRSVALEPMPAYERRVIHAYLSEEREVETESTGSDPNRRIIIKLKPKGSII